MYKEGGKNNFVGQFYQKYMDILYAFNLSNFLNIFVLRGPTPNGVSFRPKDRNRNRINFLEPRSSTLEMFFTPEHFCTLINFFPYFLTFLLL